MEATCHRYHIISAGSGYQVGQPQYIASQGRNPFDDNSLKLSAAVHRVQSNLFDKSPVVALVMRWNQRDDMLWTIYSEFAHQLDPKNTVLQQRIPITHPAYAQSASYHAEELMIVHWNNFEKEASALCTTTQTADFSLQKVEIIISKTPCNGPKGSPSFSHAGIDCPGTGP
jgi:hypothetical protein